MLVDQARLIADYPDVPDYRNSEGRNLFDYGKRLIELGDSVRASDFLNQAVTRFEEALQGDPGNRIYTRNRYEALTSQMLIALELKQVERAGDCQSGLSGSCLAD